MDIQELWEPYKGQAKYLGESELIGFKYTKEEVSGPLHLIKYIEFEFRNSKGVLIVETKCYYHTGDGIDSLIKVSVNEIGKSIEDKEEVSNLLYDFMTENYL